MRKILLESEEVLESLKIKDNFTQRINELQEAIKEIEKEYNQIIAELGREDEKVRLKIKPQHEEIKASLGEYEDISRVYLDENKKEAYFEIVDRLEEFKVFYAQEKAKQNNSGDSVSADGNSGTDTQQPTEASQESNS